jgi:hypothetical protein
MGRCERISAGLTVGGGLRPILCALLILIGPNALADDKVRGRVEIRSAYSQLTDDVYYLNARIDFVLGDAVRAALDNGVTLDVELRINVTETRRFLWDSSVASLRQRYQLSFHALTQRFLLRNLNSGEQESYGNLLAVISQLGRIQNLPIIDAAILDDDGRYQVNLRAILDLKQASGAMRLLSAVWGDWRITSESYSWPLRP